MIEIKIKVAGETVAEAVTELVKAVGEQNEELQALLAANPAPVPEEDNPEGVTLDEVRAVLLTCRDRGINQAEIVKLFAPDLTSVKKVDYPKLMAAALNALENAAVKAMDEALDRHEAAQQVKENNPVEDEPAGHPDPVGEPGPSGVPGSVDESPAEESEPTETYTKEEVRALLAEARAKDIDIKALMKPFGGPPLNAVDPSQYGALMVRTRAALADKVVG